MIAELTKDQWNSVSSLLDQALDLAPDARAAWLEGLGPEHAAALPLLRRFLDRAVSLPESDILSTLSGRWLAFAGAASDPSEELSPGQAIGPYRLIRPLGFGGMGTVWLAERGDGLLNRPVALKLPHLMGERGTLARRFARERQILSVLAHPNIARLYDAGVSDDGRPFLALEYVQGRTITDYCQQEGLGIRQRVQLFLQVLEAVRYAHANLVIHRDLKPSNLLVNDAGQVQLLDFGIAKLLEDAAATEGRATELTALGGVAMTPQYAAPEQILGKPIGTAADIYSLGVVLFELLTSTQPYRLRTRSRRELEEAIVTVDAVRPSAALFARQDAADGPHGVPQRLGRLLRGDLDTIVLKALKKDTAQRYLSVESFAQDLNRYLQGRAVLARPDAPWYRLRKFLRRNWLPTSAGVAVVLALSLGLAVALWQAQRAQQKELAAEREAAKSRAALGFVNDLFSSNSSNQQDPVKARARTARELLDAGASKIDSALADAPQAKLDVYGNLATLYAELGLGERAIALARKRVALARQLYGESHVEYVDALLGLGDLAQLEEASADMSEALQRAGSILDALGDTTSVRRAHLEFALAGLYSIPDEPRSFEHANKAVTLLQKYLPGERRMMVGALQWQALGRSHRTDYAGALEAGRRAIDLAEQGDTPLRGELPMLYGVCGLAHYSQGQYTEAVADYDRAYQVERDINGPGSSSPDEVAMGTNLAIIHARLSRLRDSLAALDGFQAAALRQVEQGDRSGNAAHITIGSAMVALEFGRPEAAAAKLLLAERLIGRNPVEADVRVEIHQARAALALQSGDTRTALQRLALAEQLAAGIGRTGRNLNNITALKVRAQLAAGQLAQAGTTLKAHVAGTQLPGRPTLDALTDQLLHAEVAVKSGDAAAALRIAQGALAAIDASGQAPVFAKYAFKASMLEGAAAQLQADDNLARVAFERAVSLASAVYDTASPALADAQIGLAASNLRREGPAAAAPLLASARRIVAAHAQFTRDAAERLRAVERLCACAGAAPAPAF